jgi:hypothetical protein
MAEEGIRGIVDRIKDEFKPKLVILFGSRARGDYLKDSDYDLIIVSERFKNFDFRERIVKVYELVDRPVRLDVLCYTPEEFERKKNQICIVKKAVEEGKVL